MYTHVFYCICFHNILNEARHSGAKVDLYWYVEEEDNSK